VHKFALKNHPDAGLGVGLFLLAMNCSRSSSARTAML
jgi:hypothetical protein